MNTTTTERAESNETTELTESELATVIGGCNPEADSDCGGGTSGGSSG